MRVVAYQIPENEKVLYNLGLLLCKLSKNDKIGVFCGDEINPTDIDKTLWTFSTNVFLPHDIATGDLQQDEKQPVLISNDYEKLNRKILCILSEDKLFFVLKNTNTLNRVNTVVFLTQNDFDASLLQNQPDIDSIDIFKKDYNNKWFRVI